MTNHTSQSFGEALRAARTQAGVAQATLASELGVSKGYLSGVERGVDRPLSLVLLKKAAFLLRADIKPLLRARATCLGVLEVPVTGDTRLDNRAISLAVEALERTP